MQNNWWNFFKKYHVSNHKDIGILYLLSLLKNNKNEILFLKTFVLIIVNTWNGFSATLLYWWERKQVNKLLKMYSKEISTNNLIVLVIVPLLMYLENSASNSGVVNSSKGEVWVTYRNENTTRRCSIERMKENKQKYKKWK